jgi:hypothetical protein
MFFFYTSYMSINNVLSSIVHSNNILINFIQNNPRILEINNNNQGIRLLPERNFNRNLYNLVSSNIEETIRTNINNNPIPEEELTNSLRNLYGQSRRSSIREEILDIRGESGDNEIPSQIGLENNEILIDFN